MKNLLAHSIVFAQAQINYTDLCCADGKKITVTKTLKKIEEELLTSGLFLRINKGCLINRNFIKCIVLEEAKVYMNNDIAFAISRRRLKILRKTA